jgi:membrane protease YdiL (CAAX protease family)
MTIGSIELILFYVFFTILLLALIRLLSNRIPERKNLISWGIGSNPKRLYLILKGWILDSLVVVLIFAVLFLKNWVQIESILWLSDDDWVSFVISAGTLLIVAVPEELLFRGIILQVTTLSHGYIVGSLVQSDLFGLFHISSPNFTWLSTINLIIGGFAYGLSYLVTGSLWFSLGQHLAWNFVQSSVFGLPLSGLKSSGLIKTTITGPSLYTGGGYGPEGGLISIAARLLGILFIILYGYKENGRKLIKF